MNSCGPAWLDRRCLVTGCSGFVGRWLVQRLCDNGARVVGFTRKPQSNPRAGSITEASDRFFWVVGDLADEASLQETLNKHTIDTVFHLAAQSKADRAQENPPETFEANIRGTWNLLEAVHKTGRPISVVLASTDMVYGSSAESPYTETSPMIATSPYATSKACAELLAGCYYRTFGLRVCVARTSNLYGGGDLGFQRIVPGTIRSVIAGEPPVINSTGQLKRDYLYVEDAVSGYMLLALAMERPEICGGTFNFSTGSPVSVLQVVETILRLTGRTDLRPRVLGRDTTEPIVRESSSARAGKELGWVADSSLDSGLKKTIEWYQSHLNEVRVEVRNC